MSYWRTYSFATQRGPVTGVVANATIAQVEPVVLRFDESGARPLPIEIETASKSQFCLPTPNVSLYPTSNVGTAVVHLNILSVIGSLAEPSRREPKALFRRAVGRARVRSAFARKSGQGMLGPSIPVDDPSLP